MRKPTKEALQHLAQTMVESDSYISLRGTAKFIEWALRLHKMTGSYVTTQTIRTHQQDLEEMCQAEMLKKYPIKKDIIVPKQFDDDVDSDYDDDYDAFEDEEFYWASGDMVDHDAVIRRGLELAMKKFEKDDSKRFDEIVGDFFSDENLKELHESQFEKGLIYLGTPVKNYSMFIESEDGLRIIRGEYKGLYVSEIDAQRWTGCAIGWSRYQLKQNEELGANRQGALTDDDKNVFLDIISGKDV